jgi:hypothetical protein
MMTVRFIEYLNALSPYPVLHVARAQLSTKSAAGAGAYTRAAIEAVTPPPAPAS